MTTAPNILDGLFLYMEDDLEYKHNSDKITEWLMLEYYALDGDLVFDDPSHTDREKEILKNVLKKIA